MGQFHPDSYGPVFERLLREPHLSPLGPGTPNDAVHGELQACSVERAFGHTHVRSPLMASCCVSAVWLYHDFLDECHHICQEIETREGSYWHGIMHRREPDYSNAKYWFRRVGRHPVFEPLAMFATEVASKADRDDQARRLTAQNTWDPLAFVDLCQAAAHGRSGSELLCRQIQQREWELLFDYCYRGAVGA